MEYLDLVQERLANYEQERKHIERAAELKRLGLVQGARSPLAHLDGLLVRVSRGAAEREARREYSNQRELFS